MASQSPMISVPKKGTDEVDWTSPIRSAISQSYGEDPDNYATECVSLQRCRQDAVKGAGSDITARDLLYKYFGQLELLELRFPEIRVNFPWRDAFTNKLIVQTSLAYEKASVIFQIAATHSAIAASQSRSDPEGLKRAFYYLRCCAGMLTYINENFLHAPSTDLSREVIKFLVGVILAQATEVFWEKCRDEKKGNALVSKVASQAASMYTSLNEEVKEFMGKGIFDRNWVTVLQIKAKYFASLTQFYRALADDAASKYGDALARFQLAESAAKEAHKTASNFNTTFLPQMSPNLPADSGQALFELSKSQLALSTERRAQAQRDNDLIYNAVLPTAETLPPVEKTIVATAIPIQEVYGTPEVQKVIGSDLFVRLIPLSVHESASVYSEEKAKLVRSEVEKAEAAVGEVRSALDALGVKAGLPRFRAMVEGSVAGEDEIPLDVRRHRDDIGVIEERESVDTLLKRLDELKDTVRVELDSIARDLDTESQDCEAMRVKYEHHFSQVPSSGLTKELRADLKSHLQALNAAAASDGQVQALWDSAKEDVRLLISGDVEKVFKDSARSHDRRESLLDLDADKDDAEKEKIARLVEDIDERLGRLNKIEKERDQTLKDLKEKIQTDDVSHLLLLNRRNPNVEPTIFASELEKFRPYQQRLGQTVHHQQSTIQEITQLWRALKDLAGRGEGARKWDERERRKKEAVRRFSQASERYMEIRDGLAKGLQFYSELSGLTSTLHRSVKDYVTSRKSERDSLVAQADTQQRLSGLGTHLVSSPPKPPPPPPPPASSLSQALSSMSLQSRQTSSNPPPPPGPWPPTQRAAFSSYPNYSPPTTQPYPSPSPASHSSPFIPPPPVQSPHAQASTRPSYSLTPPVQTPYGAAPVPPQRDPYADLGSLSGSGHFPPPPPQRQSSYPLVGQPQSQIYQSHPPPAHAAHAVYPYSTAPPPPARQGSTGTGLPPPPPPVSYSQPPPPQSYNVSARPHYGSPPPSGQQQPYGGYGQYGR
ncbi:BRO1-domain-containing protein [Lactarius akahatsu]|uniref:BRO domain-containing protein 1 n=1 Tax=Lactarius akahatsu TaxID=416441 RepID=A0AAD4QGN9_9AGAM|nr:BRO1-domain-containing protein [Lactarius akahatsu]